MRPPLDYFKPSPYPPTRPQSRLRLKELTPEPELPYKERLGLAMEDYFAGGLMIAEISQKRGISQYMISKTIRSMFAVRMTENTSVITMQSKINEDVTEEEINNQ